MMLNNKVVPFLILCLFFYCSRNSNPDSESPVKFILANISTSQGTIHNIVWQTSLDSTLIHVYANQYPKNFTKKDLITKTRQSSTRLVLDQNKEIQFVHLVIPEFDTLSLEIARLPIKERPAQHDKISK